MGITFRRFALAAGGYVAIVFPLALVWHLLLFPDLYRRFGYFEGDPNILFGFLSILVQGLTLAALYPRFESGSRGIGRALRFGALLGLFYWTCHVLALIAKQNVPDAATFMAMESVYLGFQFGLFALWIAFLHRHD